MGALHHLLGKSDGIRLARCTKIMPFGDQHKTRAQSPREPITNCFTSVVMTRNTEGCHPLSMAHSCEQVSRQERCCVS